MFHRISSSCSLTPFTSLPLPSPPLLPPQEVTQQLAQYWQKWVNFTDISMETAKRSACYSVVIPNTNLKLVSFNANYGYVLIWCPSPTMGMVSFNANYGYVLIWCPSMPTMGMSLYGVLQCQLWVCPYMVSFNANYGYVLIWCPSMPTMGMSLYGVLQCQLWVCPYMVSFNANYGYGVQLYLSLYADAHA